MLRRPLVFGLCWATVCLGATEPAGGFAEQVGRSFARWDRDHDGVLTSAELDVAVADPVNQGRDAAALAALKRASRSTRLKVPPLILPYVRATAAAAPVAGQPDFNKMYQEGLAALATATRREALPDGLPRLDTIHQGRLGNCFCLAPLGALVHRDPRQVAAMFGREADGAYLVTLGSRVIRVIPPTDAELAMTSSNEGAGLWVNLYEKAVGIALNEARPVDQRAGSPMDVLAKGGSAGTMLEFITGKPIRRITFAFAKDAKLDEVGRAARRRELGEQLEAAVRDRRLMTCGTLAVTTPGLTPNHAYAVLGYDASSRRVRLWNPHGGSFKPKGESGPMTGYPMQDGVFELGLDEWTKQFSGMAYATER